MKKKWGVKLDAFESAFRFRRMFSSLWAVSILMTACSNGSADAPVQHTDQTPVFSRATDAAVEAPSFSPTRTHTAMPTSTPEPSPTSTHTPKPTASPTSTPTPIPTSTRTPKPTASPTSTPEPSPTNTHTPEPTATPASTPRPEATVTIRLSEAIPWFTDPPTLVHNRVADKIARIWVLDPYLAGEIAALPWFQDGISKEDRHAVSDLHDLSRLDVQLVRKVIGIPQLLDEYDPHLGGVFLHILSVAENDLELARWLVEYSWVTDGVSDDEEQTLFSLRNIAEADVETALKLASYPWMADLLTDREQQALRVLDSYAGYDPGYMGIVIDSAWIGDGIDDDEFVKMALALPVDMKDELVNDLSEGLREYLIHSLVTLGKVSSRHLLSLGARDWVADGLTNEEAAFITSISRVPIDNPGGYERLLLERFAQTGTISLPVSGEVNVWVFSNAPHLDEVNMLRPIEYAVGVGEDFLQVPVTLLTKDIVVLLFEDQEGDETIGSLKTSTHVQMGGGRGALYELSGGAKGLYHEMAHYYFSRSWTNRWMSEGGAELIEDLAYHRGEIGGSSPGGIRAARGVQECMEAYGFENIRHLHHVQRNNYREWDIQEPYWCFYAMGRNFLQVLRHHW